jgi:hypothetical protein
MERAILLQNPHWNDKIYPVQTHLFKILVPYLDLNIRIWTKEYFFGKLKIKSIFAFQLIQ